MSEILNTPTTQIIYDYLQKHTQFMSSEEFFNEFEFFIPELQIVQNQSDIELLANEFFQFRIFVKQFGVVLKVEDCQVCFSPQQLSQFCINRFEAELISNPRECIEQCRTIYQEQLPTAADAYPVQLPDQPHIKLLFGEQRQEDVYFLYFLALIMLRAAMNQLGGATNLRLFLTGNSSQGMQTKENGKMRNAKQQTSFNSSENTPGEQDESSDRTKAQGPEMQTCTRGSASQQLQPEYENAENEESLQVPVCKAEQRPGSDVGEESDPKTDDEFQPIALSATLKSRPPLNGLDGELLEQKDNKLLYLENENLYLKKEVQDLPNIEFLESRIKHLEDQALTNEEQLEEKDKIIEKQLAQITELELGLKRQQADENLQEENDALKEELREVQNSLEEIEHQLNEKAVMNHGLEMENTELGLEVEHLTSQLQTNKQQSRELAEICTQKNADLIKEMEAKDATIIELQARLSLKNENQLEYESSQQNSIEKYKEMLVQREDELFSLKQQNAEQTIKLKEMVVFKERLEEFEKSLVIVQEENRQQLDIKQRDIDKFEQQYTKSSEVNKMLIGKSEELLKALSAMDVKHRQLLQYYTELFNKHSQLISLVNGYANTATDAKKAMYDQLAVKYATLESNYTQLVESDEALRASYVDLKQTFNAKIDAIKLELERHPGIESEDLTYFIDADRRQLEQVKSNIRGEKEAEPVEVSRNEETQATVPASAGVKEKSLLPDPLTTPVVKTNPQDSPKEKSGNIESSTIIQLEDKHMIDEIPAIQPVMMEKTVGIDEDEENSLLAGTGAKDDHNIEKNATAVIKNTELKQVTLKSESESEEVKLENGQRSDDHELEPPGNKGLKMSSSNVDKSGAPFASDESQHEATAKETDEISPAHPSGQLSAKDSIVYKYPTAINSPIKDISLEGLPHVEPKLYDSREINFSNFEAKEEPKKDQEPTSTLKSGMLPGIKHISSTTTEDGEKGNAFQYSEIHSNQTSIIDVPADRVVELE